jgi:hypothetical protein
MQRFPSTTPSPQRNGGKRLRKQISLQGKYRYHRSSILFLVLKKPSYAYRSLGFSEPKTIYEYMEEEQNVELNLLIYAFILPIWKGLNICGTILM